MKTQCLVQNKFQFIDEKDSTNQKINRTQVIQTTIEKSSLERTGQLVGAGRSKNPPKNRRDKSF